MNTKYVKNLHIHPTLPEKKYHKVNVFLNDILPSQTLQIIRFCVNKMPRKLTYIVNGC